jgi:chromosomal replication initiation ATPase DnaA
MDKRLIHIKNTVCKVLKSNLNEFDPPDAKHYYHYLCKEFTFIKLKEIIKLSGVSHSSVYHSYHTIEKWLRTDKEAQENIEKMKYLLRDKLFNMQF